MHFSTWHTRVIMKIVCDWIEKHTCYQMNGGCAKMQNVSGWKFAGAIDCQRRRWLALCWLRELTSRKACSIGICKVAVRSCQVGYQEGIVINHWCTQATAFGDNLQWLSFAGIDAWLLVTQATTSSCWEVVILQLWLVMLNQSWCSGCLASHKPPVLWWVISL